jgi:hypothetical protein
MPQFSIEGIYFQISERPSRRVTALDVNPLRSHLGERGDPKVRRQMSGAARCAPSCASSERPGASRNQGAAAALLGLASGGLPFFKYKAGAGGGLSSYDTLMRKISLRDRIYEVPSTSCIRQSAVGADGWVAACRIPNPLFRWRSGRWRLDDVRAAIDWGVSQVRRLLVSRRGGLELMARAYNPCARQLDNLPVGAEPVFPRPASWYPCRYSRKNSPVLVFELESWSNDLPHPPREFGVACHRIPTGGMGDRAGRMSTVVVAGAYCHPRPARLAVCNLEDRGARGTPALDLDTGARGGSSPSPGPEGTWSEIGGARYAASRCGCTWQYFDAEAGSFTGDVRAKFARASSPLHDPVVLSLVPHALCAATCWRRARNGVILSIV